MNKKEYLDKLSENLLKIPFEERRNTVLYYNEYFEEAGADHEQEVISELGAPETLAKKILADFTVRDTETPTPTKSVRSNSKHIWMIILGIFALPLALPILITLASLFFVAFIMIFVVMVTVGAVFFSLIVTGVAMFIGGIFAVFTHFPTGMLFMGMGLAGMGLFMLIVGPCVALIRWLFSSTVKLLGRIFRRKSKA